MAWKDGTLTQATIRSTLGRPCTVRYGQKTARLGTKAGTSYALDGTLKTR